MVRRAAPALLPLWGLLKPIERADLWRYVVLYERGGW
jgi:mannosyltransferase OCH1-like enzyme